MKAAVVRRYGPPEVVRIENVPELAARRGEVVVRVLATTVNSGDARIRGSRFPRGMGLLGRLALGIRGPRTRVLGLTFSGVIEAVGVGVDGLTPGDAVCGMTGARLGAHAELLAVRADRVARKPASVSHDDAAGVLFGGATAWHFLHRLGGLKAGATLLIIGASGAVGTAAVQLGRYLGAHVTAVTSAANADLVTKLGAHQVIDYTRTDVDTIAEQFDVVFDTVGRLTTPAGRRLLNPGGVLLLAAASLGQLLGARGQVRAGTSPERAEDFEFLVRLVSDGTLQVVIDQILPLDDIVEAHRRVDSGHKVGALVVRPTR